MLANAVKEQKKDAHQVAKPLAQQIFSSSPPESNSVGARSHLALGPAGQVLQPSVSMLNRAGGLAVKPFKNPLKRSSSGMSGSSDMDASNKVRKQTGLSRQQSFSTSASKTVRQNSGLLGKLHSDFGFDENEFDEDLLMLATDPSPKRKVDEATVKYPDLKPPEPYYPKLPANQESYRTRPNGRPEPLETPPIKSAALKSSANSSAPLPWSSSPDSHRFDAKRFAKPARLSPEPQQPITTAKKQLFGRQLSSLAFEPAVSQQTVAPKLKASLTETQIGDRDAPIELDTSPELPKEKRRILPWKSGKDEEETNDLVAGDSKRMRRPKKERPTPDPDSAHVAASAAKEKTEGKLWEQHASAVKAEQKKFRQQRDNDVQSKTNENSPDEGQTTSNSHRPKTSAAKNVSPVFLSDEQHRVLNLVSEKKKSVFFTGSAGTGKSVLMREIISALRKKYDKAFDAVAVTASTGLAACNIGGNTLHSFAGIGLGSEPADQLIKKIRKNPKALQRWQRTRVLVIDEISMIDGVLFDKLEQIARVIRKKPKAFGGIQLVITGDFFQLPPVAKAGESSFTFDATTWKTAIDHTIGLTHVFRQKDPIFAGMLNEMRVGRLTPASIKAFNSLNRPIRESEGREATELFPTRQEVENANQNRMRRLIGTPVEFPAIDGGTLKDINQRSKLLANCMAPASLTLKKGAQVMLIKNIDETLVNGSVGQVIGFMTEQQFEHYCANEWLYTKGIPDVPSPTASNDTGPLPEVPGSSLTKDMEATKEYRDFINLWRNPSSANTAPCYPVVRFKSLDGGSDRDLLCTRETWKIEQPNGEVLAQRAQVPLILAWALSIHKAQGQTLEMVKVDLGRIFEKGQAYVALSRATTQEGLQVARFDPRKVMAHDKVRKFYDTLYGVDTIGGMPQPAAKPTAVGRVDAGISPEDEEALLQMEFGDF